MAKPKEIRINLLPQKEFEASILGRILKWALSTLRIIVIVTEMLVMSAFLLRFWLDAKNSDLNEAISQKIAVISAYQDVENEFRLAQKKINIFAKLTQEPIKSEKIKVISQSLPPEISLTSVSLDKDSFQIKGVSGNEQSISQFIVNLESAEEFSQVELVQLDSDKENPFLIIFILKAKWH
jgi:Tfp pilus assembly protein PilN